MEVSSMSWWWHRTVQSFLLYAITGIGILPGAVLYAWLKLNGAPAPWLIASLIGAAVLGIVVLRTAEPHFTLLMTATLKRVRGQSANPFSAFFVQPPELAKSMATEASGVQFTAATFEVSH